MNYTLILQYPIDKLHFGKYENIQFPIEISLGTTRALVLKIN